MNSASDQWYSPPAPQRHRGPVVLRGKQARGSTTDQRLLDSRGSGDWVHTDPWRVLRIQAEFVEGFGVTLVRLGDGGGIGGDRHGITRERLLRSPSQIGRIGAA